MSDWKDIIELGCGEENTIARCADGTARATGYNLYSQCEVDKWKDLRLPSVPLD